MELNKQKTVSLSGNCSEIVANKCYDDIYNAICESHLKGYDTFLCGMMEGFDAVAAKAVINARRRYPKIQLVAVIPLIWFYRKFTTHSYEQYTILLENCEHIEVLPTMESRNIFFYRNKFLVENTTLVICHYDGKKCETMQLTDIAKIKNIPINNLLKTHQQITHEMN